MDKHGDGHVVVIIYNFIYSLNWISCNPINSRPLFPKTVNQIQIKPCQHYEQPWDERRFDVEGQHLGRHRRMAVHVKGRQHHQHNGDAAHVDNPAEVFVADFLHKYNRKKEGKPNGNFP